MVYEECIILTGKDKIMNTRHFVDIKQRLCSMS